MTTDRDAAAAAYAEKNYPMPIWDKADKRMGKAAFRAGWDAAMEWKPIESAPKDGTRILLWIEPTKIAMPFEWSGERWMGDDYPLNMAEATHWMPLPQPPASTGKGA